MSNVSRRRQIFHGMKRLNPIEKKESTKSPKKEIGKGK